MTRNTEVAKTETSNIDPLAVTADSLAVSVLKSMGLTPEIVMEDFGEPVNFENVRLFVGEMMTENVVEQKDIDSPESNSRLVSVRTMRQIHSVDYGGHPEIDVNGVEVPIGAKRALWGSHNLDRALGQKLQIDGTIIPSVRQGDIVAIECLGLKNLPGGRSVRTFNVAVQRRLTAPADQA